MASAGLFIYRTRDLLGASLNTRGRAVLLFQHGPRNAGCNTAVKFVRVKTIAILMRVVPCFLQVLQTPGAWNMPVPWPSFD